MEGTPKSSLVDLANPADLGRRRKSLHRRVSIGRELILPILPKSLNESEKEEALLLQARENAQSRRLLNGFIDIADAIKNVPQSESSRITPGLETSDSDASLESDDSVLALQEEWSAQGSHIEYAPTEPLPFVHGRSLGHGSGGEVVEITYKGVDMALKKVYQRRKVQNVEIDEIEVLKRLSHRHIVTLVGTYYQKPYLGLLIWPVATCDLALYMELLNTRSIDDVPFDKALQESNITSSDFFDIYNRYMYATYGYLTSAVAYLHSNNIRHKDIKPSNILLSPSGMWLTDFGSAKDFTDDLTSTSESRERGTLRYCAPEVSKYQRSGRSADIFSLGCVFLEFTVALSDHDLSVLYRLRPAGVGSYGANLDKTEQWMALIPDDYGDFFGYRVNLRALVRTMLDNDRFKRPSALTTLHQLSAGIVDKETDELFCDRCRKPFELNPIDTYEKLKEAKRENRALRRSIKTVREVLDKEL